MLKGYKTRESLGISVATWAVSSTSDDRLFQHQITSNFYITVSYKRNQWFWKV